MTRFGVMKHLRVLEDAGLVVTRKVGREKLHFLNVIPIRLIHDRWVGKYAERWATALTGLKRELEEETGYRAGRWERLITFFPSPGVLDERTHLFAASDLTPGEMRLEPGEEIEPHAVPLTRAVGWALDGTIRDAKTIIALLWWNARRQTG